MSARPDQIANLDIPTHLISFKDVTPKFLNLLLGVAHEMERLVENEGGDDRLKHKILALVFYEVTSVDNLQWNCSHI